tara:strand:- start:2391 stop:3149 length:759 start_codon:yes stop_codon:yes gene_type:complete
MGNIMNEAQSSANRSETIGKLAAALSKFQAEVENPTKDSQGHNYKYADLANILNAVKQPLTNNKLSVCQMLGSSAQGISVTTILMHESGEYIESMLSLPQEANSRMSAPQQAGTTITYARRYALAACLGIAQQDDDAPKPSVSDSDEEKTEPVNQSPQPKNTEQLTRLAKDACAEIHAMTKVGQIHIWTANNEKKLETLKASNEALLLMVTNALDDKNKELTEQEMPIAKTHGKEPDPLPPVPPLNDEEIPF